MGAIVARTYGGGAKQGGEKLMLPLTFAVGQIPVFFGLKPSSCIKISLQFFSSFKFDIIFFRSAKAI